jgi:hypothetical protein
MAYWENAYSQAERMGRMGKWKNEEMGKWNCPCSCQAEGLMTRLNDVVGQAFGQPAFAGRQAGNGEMAAWGWDGWRVGRRWLFPKKGPTYSKAAPGS